jgi:hypothetical protein
VILRMVPSKEGVSCASSVISRPSRRLVTRTVQRFAPVKVTV